jgi:hypothetical protein
MANASKMIMGALSCRVDVDIIRSPDRYRDGGGGEMWDRVMGLLDTIELEVGHE